MSSKKSSLSKKWNNSLVTGYIKQKESELEILNIPQVIIHLILTYYQMNDFIDTYLANYFLISSDKSTITNIRSIKPGLHGIYLNEWIESISNQSFTWTFLINKLKDWIYFGIVTSQIDTRCCFQATYFEPNYRISNKGHLNGYHYDHRLSHPKYPNISFGDGDKVRFTLNMKQQTWSVSINNGLYIMIINNVEKSDKIKWKMALSLQNKGDSISVINFYSHS